jgi:mycofactocin system glycosyltransferase
VTLPDGFAIELDAGVKWLGDRVLLGGAPPRILRLSARATVLLASGRLTVTDATSAALARSLLDAGAAHPRPVPGGPRPPVSVVIPVRDRAPALRRLLGALDGTLPAGSEILVVDDGSANPAELAETAGRARVLRHERSRGPAAARNTGLAAARHEFVAFLDSDVVPRPGWLVTLLAHFDDPAVGMAAPRIVGLRAQGEGALARYEHARSSLDLGRVEALIVPRTRVAYVPSAALAVRRAVVGDGFAEDLHVAEDVDLVHRLHAAGVRMRYDPAAEVAHEHRVRLGPWLARKAFYGTGAAPLAVRHPGQVPPVHLPIWAATAVVLLGTQRRCGVLAAGAVIAASTVRLGRELRGLPRPLRTAARLGALTTAAAAWQAAGALTRHWWPVALAAAPVSRRVRRALAVAALAEGLADWAIHRGELDPARYVLLHRLDDLAYGAGLWWGALAHRTPAPLLPRLTGLTGLTGPRTRGRGRGYGVRRVRSRSAPRTR